MLYNSYTILPILIGTLLWRGGFFVSAQNSSLQSTNFVEQAYTVKGALVTIGSLSPKLTLTNVYNFTLYRSQYNWKIEMKTDQSSYTGVLTSFEWGLANSTNCYQLDVYEDTDKDAINDYSLTLYSKKIPKGHVAPIWLAFIGGSELDYLGKGTVETAFPPEGEEKFYERRLKIPAEWNYYSTETSFPMLSFYVDYLSNTKNQTNAYYHVQSWTNTLGKSFPLKAEVCQYFTPSNINHFELTVESIDPRIPDNIFVFAPPPKTMVYDKRFLLEDNIPILYDYFSKTGGVFSVETVVSEPRFHDLAANARMEANAPKRNVWWIYGVTVILLGLPFMFALKNKKNNQ